VAEAISNNGPARTDDRNLLQDAVDKGYVVIRTRAQYEDLMDKLASAPLYAPKVLGLFAASDIFNDEEEEELFSLDFIRSGLDPIPPEVVGQPELQDKIGDLLLWGTPNRPFGPINDDGEQLDNPFSVNPPSAAEMAEMAIIILDRRSRLEERKPFHLVCEVESTDNMPNKNNSIGTLRALKRADDMIKVAREYEQKMGALKGGFRGKPSKTLILTAADSDGSALQVLSLRRGTTDTPFNPLECNQVGNADRSECIDQGEKTTVTTVNPEFSTFEGVFADISTQAVDGIGGRRSEAFVAEPDALSDERVALGGFPDEDDSGAGSFGGLTVDDAKLPFAVTWATVQDTAGAIISRAQGRNAKLLRTRFSARFDNTDVYRMMYFTLFGKVLPSGVNKVAEDRP
jgi:alkaline phosphatase